MWGACTAQHWGLARSDTCKWYNPGAPAAQFEWAVSPENGLSGKEEGIALEEGHPARTSRFGTTCSCSGAKLLACHYPHRLSWGRHGAKEVWTCSTIPICLDRSEASSRAFWKSSWIPWPANLSCSPFKDNETADAKQNGMVKQAFKLWHLGLIFQCPFIPSWAMLIHSASSASCFSPSSHAAATVAAGAAGACPSSKGAASAGRGSGCCKARILVRKACFSSSVMLWRHCSLYSCRCLLLPASRTDCTRACQFCSDSRFCRDHPLSGVWRVASCFVCAPSACNLSFKFFVKHVRQYCFKHDLLLSLISALHSTHATHFPASGEGGAAGGNTRGGLSAVDPAGFNNHVFNFARYGTAIELYREKTRSKRDGNEIQPCQLKADGHISFG